MLVPVINYRYRHMHAYKPVEDWRMSVPYIKNATYQGYNQTLILWPKDNISDIQVFKNVTIDCINSIRTQLRQIGGWYIEAQADDVIVWNFLGVYDEKLQNT